MGSRIVFDQPHYDVLNAAREAVLQSLLADLKRELELRTAVDIGCGVGRFASLLHGSGFTVLALDGRQENVDEAKRRCAGIEFRVADAEDTALRSLGKFDLALFLGLFYHLENPFVAIRNLYVMTGKVAILEGIVAPGDEPVLAVRDEGSYEDQGLRYVAMYPTEAGLIKMLYRAGYPYVFRLAAPPKHPEYSPSFARRKGRTMLVASVVPLSTGLLRPAMEPATAPDPWKIRNNPIAFVVRALNAVPRLWKFAAKPWPEQRKILSQKWNRLFSSPDTSASTKVRE